MRDGERQRGRSRSRDGQAHAERHERQRRNQEARPDVRRVGDQEDHGRKQ